MKEYKFSLADFGGCYIVVRTSTLKYACEIFTEICKTVGFKGNSAVNKVEVSRKEVVYDREFNEA